MHYPGILSGALARLAVAGASVVFWATAAHATNEEYQFSLESCSPEILGGCLGGAAFTPSPVGYNVGGAYAFASGYRGGFTLASAGFAPGAPALLSGGSYRNGAVSFMTYCKSGSCGARRSPSTAPRHRSNRTTSARPATSTTTAATAGAAAVRSTSSSGLFELRHPGVDDVERAAGESVGRSAVLSH